MQLRHLLTLRDHPEASNPGDEQNAPPLMAKDLVVSYPHHRTPVQTSPASGSFVLCTLVAPSTLVHYVTMGNCGETNSALPPLMTHPPW